MPTKTGKTYASYYKNDLAINQTSNTGVDATTRLVHDGAGNSSALSLSDDVVSIQPVNDDTTGTMLVKNNAGNNILAVDTDNGKVLAGASQVAVNTQYAHFGISNADVFWDDVLADTHYAVPFSNAAGAFMTNAIANFAMGTSTSSSFNDTDPASSLTITTTAMDIVQTYWYVMDDITIDRVVWWSGADTATTDPVVAYLMGYTVDATSAATGGDLSSGVKLASSSTVTSAGYRQINYDQMSLEANVDVDAGKVILFTFAADTVNSDYSINATVKYHLR